MSNVKQIMEKIRWINPIHVIILIGVSGVLVVFFQPLAEPSEVGEFVSTLYAVNLTGNILTLGVPFLIGSIISWNTKKAHNSMAKNDASLHHRIRCYVTRYIIANMIAFLFMAAVCIWGFSSAAANPGHLPGIVLACMGVSLVLNSLTFFIAIAVDSPFYTIFVTTGIFVYFSLYYGYSGLSATGGVSLYAPYHLFRFLAIFLTGYEFANESVMENYLGVIVQPIDLLGPLLAWLLISVGCIGFSIILLRNSMERWVHEETASKGDPRFTQTPTEETVPSIEKRQKIASIAVILLFVSTVSYNLFANNPPGIPESMYLYQSPETGESIALGSWTYDNVEVSASQISEAEGWTLKVTILDWGEYDGGEGLRIRYGFLMYSLSDFAALNNTEREDVLTSRTWGINPEHPSTGTGVHHQLDGAGTYLWGVRITDDSHENASYVVSASIEVYLNPE